MAHPSCVMQLLAYIAVLALVAAVSFWLGRTTAPRPLKPLWQALEEAERE